jgi:hypothetical protein
MIVDSSHRIAIRESTINNDSPIKDQQFNNDYRVAGEAADVVSWSR